MAIKTQMLAEWPNSAQSAIKTGKKREYAYLKQVETKIVDNLAKVGGLQKRSANLKSV
jgi:hypothetical protein